MRAVQKSGRFTGGGCPATGPLLEASQILLRCRAGRAIRSLAAFEAA